MIYDDDDVITNVQLNYSVRNENRSIMFEGRLILDFEEYENNEGVSALKNIILSKLNFLIGEDNNEV